MVVLLKKKLALSNLAIQRHNILLVLTFSKTIYFLIVYLCCGIYHVCALCKERSGNNKKKKVITKQIRIIVAGFISKKYHHYQ